MPLSGIAIYKIGAKRRRLHSSFLIPHSGKTFKRNHEVCSPSLHSIKIPPVKSGIFKNYRDRKSSSAASARSASFWFFSFFGTLFSSGGMRPKFTFIGWKFFPSKWEI